MKKKIDSCLELESWKVYKKKIKARYAIEYGSHVFNLPSNTELSRFLDILRTILFPEYFSRSITTSDCFLDKQIQSLTSLLEKILISCYALNWKDYQNEDAIKNLSSEISIAFCNFIDTLHTYLQEDNQTTLDSDPASKSKLEVIIAYPGFFSILVYRVANFFYLKKVPLFPRLLTEFAHSKTGIDIHPGAEIGRCFFIDHGTGVVIGETAVLGHNVKLYQGVTLGAFSVKKTTGKRHPSLGNHVTIYAGSTILGGDTIIGDHSVIGGNVWLTHSLPSYSKVYLSQKYRKESQKIIFRDNVEDQNN